jgi:uncharacterized protein YgiM (DUF1202 family)
MSLESAGRVVIVPEPLARCLGAAGASGVNFRAENKRLQRAIVRSSKYFHGDFVTVPGSFHFRYLAAAILLITLAPLGGCGHGRHHILERAYVSAPQAILRDQVAAVYNRVGTVKNGERVDVLEHEKRFARVRTSTGLEGWIEQRYLVDQKTYDGLQQLTADNKDDPVQAPGILRNDTNLHVTPGRETEHLYQLASGAKVSILKRATAEKQIGGVPAAKPIAISTPGKMAKEPGPILEDWYLVRDDQGRVGWVLARMVDEDVPLDVAQYAEGQRFVAFFVLDQVPDTQNGVQKSVPQYLCVMTEPHDGLPYDFDQIRVLTWNTKRHRYETAYREHGLNGLLPVTVGTENFDKEGTLPIFTIRVKDDAGNVRELKYKLNTPIVRRVLAPGEEPPKAVRRRKH